MTERGRETVASVLGFQNLSSQSQYEQKGGEKEQQYDNVHPEL